MLYSPELYEPLTDEAWDEANVRVGISTIVADADAAFDSETLWPAANEWDTWNGQAREPLTSLHVGAAGVVLALEMLRRRGVAETTLDLADAARRVLETWRAAPDLPERLAPPARPHASLFYGESGLLLVVHRVAPSDDVADTLFARVRECARIDDANELLHGVPGTMIAARALLDWTGDNRWADAWCESADVLWNRRGDDGFWPSPPYGRPIGASHGVGTNANVLVAGGDLFPSERHAALHEGTREALARTAVRENGFANWPVVAEDHPNLVGPHGQIRAQWCHGAAGVVASASRYLDDDLLFAGAGLTWLTGPPNMDKGPGICHGTAGSGYAFLKMFERTGDERWLDRARRFAMHALAQVERWRERRGRGRYSLWTGDVGAALFAAACLEARTNVPVVDTLE